MSLTKLASLYTMADPDTNMSPVLRDGIRELFETLAEACAEHESCTFCERPMCVSCEIFEPALHCDGTDLHCVDCAAECGPCRDEMGRDWAIEIATDGRGY